MKVQIKTWDNLVSQFGVDVDETFILCTSIFTKDMEDELPKDRIIEVQQNSDGNFDWGIWEITLDMIEKVIPESNNVAEAIKSWLSQQDDKTRTIMVNGNKSYSAQDLITEIENQTTVGKELEQSIIELTIDLLFRKKETL